MDLNAIKARLSQDLLETRSRIEQSTAFQQLRAKWDTLEPQQQKGIQIATPFLLVLILILPTYSRWSESTSNLEAYEEKKELMRTLMLTQKEITELPQIANPSGLEALRLRIQSEALENGLLPEQKQSIQTLTADSLQVPYSSKIIEGVLEIPLFQITIKQLVQLATQIEQISPQLRVENMNLSQDPKLAGYLNATLQVVVLKYSDVLGGMNAVETEANPPPRRGR